MRQIGRPSGNPMVHSSMKPKGRPTVQGGKKPSTVAHSKQGRRGCRKCK